MINSISERINIEKKGIKPLPVMCGLPEMVEPIKKKRNVKIRMKEILTCLGFCMKKKAKLISMITANKMRKYSFSLLGIKFENEVK